MMMLMMMMPRERKMMMLREDDVEEEENRSQDRDPFVGACAVKMHVNISQEQLCTEIYK